MLEKTIKTAFRFSRIDFYFVTAFYSLYNICMATLSKCLTVRWCVATARRHSLLSLFCCLCFSLSKPCLNSSLSLRLHIVNEGVGLVVLLVRGMLLTTHFAPSLVLGEEGVGVSWRVVNLSEAETVSKGERLFVDACATYYIYVLVSSAMGDGFFQRAVGVATRKRSLRTAYDDVATVGQSALGERLEGAASHYDGMTCGECLETLEVVPGQLRADWRRR